MAEKLSSIQRNWAEVLCKAQRIACLFFVLLGTFLCMEKCLASGSPLRMLIASAGISAITAEIMRHGKVQKFAAFLLLGGIVTWRNQTLLLEGGKEIANRVISLVNHHYRTEYLYWLVQQNGKGKVWVFLLLCSLVGLLEGFFLSLTYSSYKNHKLLKEKRRRNAAFLSMPLLALTAGILVGQTPSQEGLLLILAGFLASQLELNVRGTQILGVGMGLILALAVLVTGSDMAQGMLDAYHRPWLERQLHLENEMLELVDRFSGIRLFSGPKAQKEYLLNNEGPNQTGKEVFRITMEKRPEQAVYIRGFIGGDYEGGSWRRASRQEFSDWAQSQGLSNQKCQEAVQNFPYRKLKELEEKDGGRGSRQVKMELKTSVSGYTLVPYYSEIPENQPAEGDGSLAPGNKNRFQWDSFLFLERWQREGMMTLDEWKLKSSSFQGLSEKEKIWESYGAYVQQAYTRLPEQGLEKLKSLAEEYDGIGISQNVDSEIWSKSQQTLELLWGNAYYSQELDPLPEGEDFAEYFLIKQKKGFCVHFATAGTLVLRMYGVPARYVSGYVVFPEDFKKNSDGTFTAEVTDERGHAWTEVFLEETGFCPLELTPPTYFTALKDLKPEETIDDALRRKEEEELEEDETAQELKQEQEDASQEEQRRTERNEKEGKLQVTGDQAGKENPEKNIKAAGTGIFFCLLGALAVIFLLCCIRKRMRDRRQTEFFQDDHAKGALAMGKSMRHMLKSLGLEPKKEMGDLEYGAFLERELPGMEWERIVFLLQKAAFSEHGITEEEFETVAGAYRKLEQKVGNLRQR